MNTQDYNFQMTANVTSVEAMDAISRVSEWWATDFEGSSQKLHDVFSVCFGETSVTFRVEEVIPNEKIVWLVTDCHLHWINNKKEWIGTRLSWAIFPNRVSTQIIFTHIGLVPATECYNDCKEGWDFHLGKSLYKLMTEHRGIPNVNTRKLS
jgi:hypothetical protein